MGDCFIEEKCNKLGPHKCSSNFDCNGSRTCDYFHGYCQGYADCDKYDFSCDVTEKPDESCYATRECLGQRRCDGAITCNKFGEGVCEGASECTDGIESWVIWLIIITVILLFLVACICFCKKEKRNRRAAAQRNL